MAEFPALPLWTDRYLAATIHLDVIESGAYLHLLMAAWRSEGCRLPDDDKRLARFARCTPRQWSRVRDAVLSFWDKDAEGYWVQKKLLSTRLDVSKKVAANRTSASKGGKAKALKSKERALANATNSLGDQQCRNASETLPNQNQIEDSVPNGTDSLPAVDAAEAIKKAVFDEGKSLLCQAKGIAASTAGGLVIKWLKACGDNHTAVLRAVRQAASETPVPADPFPWVLERIRIERPNQNRPAWQIEEERGKQALRDFFAERGME